MSNFKFSECYASFINLDIRPDRRERMENELAKFGITATRTRGKLPHEYDLTDPKLQIQVNRTPGSIGCWYAMIEIMEEALRQNKDAWIMEDDCLFSETFNERVPYVEAFLNSHDWDIFWGGALFHCNPPHWHTGDNPHLLESNIGYDAELTEDPHIIRTLACFSTHCWIVNRNSLKKVMDLLEATVHRSIGIDHAAIVLQPQLKTFTHVPGLVIQVDGQSNIGNGITRYSGFSTLNGTVENSAYWFQENWRDFNPLTFNWAEIVKH